MSELYIQLKGKISNGVNILRKTVNNNKLYAWMIIAILFMQSYVFLHQPASRRESIRATHNNFSQEIEVNRQLLQKAIKENPKVAVNFAYISFFMLSVFILGIVFLINFLLLKAKGEDPIQKTQEETIFWNLKDVIKVIIIFLFFNYAFNIFQYLLSQFLKVPPLDKRLSMVLDTVFMDIFILLIIIRFVVVKYNQKIAALGISFKNITQNVAIALYSYLAFLPILAAVFLLIVLITQLLHYTPPQEAIYELMFKEKRPYLLIIISGMVSFIGPVVEEVFFRGFFYSALKKNLNAIKAILISAVIFSLLHTNLMAFAPIVVLGMFLAYLREKTGSLIPSICVHIIHNAALTGFMFLIRDTISLVK